MFLVAVRLFLHEGPRLIVFFFSFLDILVFLLDFSSGWGHETRIVVWLAGLCLIADDDTMGSRTETT